MSNPSRVLGAVVAEAFTAAGISENAASIATGIARQTLRRRLTAGGFTTPELEAVADVLGTVPSRLMALAEERAA